MRLEQTVDIYGDAAILKRFQAAETSISVVQGNISALISQSELIELQNSHTTMYSQMASLKMDVSSLTLDFSDLQTKYNAVSGQYTELDSKVAQYKASVDGLSATITQVRQDLDKNYSMTSEMNAAIAAKAGEITASVSSTYATKSALNNANSEIDALKSWKNEASLKITDSAIISTVTSSSSWASKADKANLISQINQSAEQIAISASKIKLEGVITANGNFKILSDGSMETIKGKLGGWVISGNQMLNNQTNFVIRLQAPTVYGSSGIGTPDVLTVHDLTNDSWPFVLTSDGTLDLGSYFNYRPNGMSYDKNVKLTVGGWQIKNGRNSWGYDHFEYWDTQETQENGICSHGPWVVWGGWNGGASLDYINNYKFVVSDKGNVYAQRFYDNGQQLLPIVVENRHVNLTANYCFISKPGYFLINCSLIRTDSAMWVTGTQRMVDGTYIILVQNANGGEADLYTVWAKEPD